MPQQPAQQMSLSQRLFSILLISFLITLVVTGIGMFSIQELSRTFGRVRASARQELLYANLNRLAAEQTAAVFGFLAEGQNADAADAAKDALESIREEGQSALAGHLNLEVYLYAGLLESAAKLEPLWSECSEAAAAAVSGGSIEKWTEKHNKFTEYVQIRAETCALDVRDRSYELDALRNRLGSIPLVISATGILIAAILSYFIVTGLLKRLRGAVDCLVTISEQAQAFTDGGSETAQSELAAFSASVAGTAADLSLYINGTGKGRHPAKAGETQTDALARQYADWVDIPPDVRAALLILARRLGENKDA